MPEIIHDCLECKEPPMLSANWSLRCYIVQCFCFVRPEIRDATMAKALRRWNEANEPEHRETPKRFYEDITGNPV